MTAWVREVEAGTQQFITASHKPVALLTPAHELVPPEMFLAYAAQGGDYVLVSTTPVAPAPAETKDCCDLSDIEAPPTPPPWSSDSNEAC